MWENTTSSIVKPRNASMYPIRWVMFYYSVNGGNAILVNSASIC